MNYRELLKRYMQHVLTEEGISFVDGWFPRECDEECRARMSAEDWTALRLIEAEVLAEREAAHDVWLHNQLHDAKGG